MSDDKKIKVQTDKNGKDHIDFYDKDPKDPDHKSIHIDWDSSTGKGKIVDNTSGSKETTDVGCYLTTACMRFFNENFNDNCYELNVLRWFRDNFVSEEDIKHYYETAPIVVEAINNCENSDLAFNYIYDNVVDYCVRQIEEGNYEEAYKRYKNSILALEETFARPYLQARLVRTLA